MKNTLRLFLVAVLLTGFTACKKAGSAEAETAEAETAAPVQPDAMAQQPAAEPGNNEKPPYTIADSSKIVTLPSGLKYYIVRQGSGNTPRHGQTVIANYHGMLTNGTVFDSSFDRGEAFQFPIGQGRVIRGWDEGFAQFTPGTRAILIIPSDLGYGPQGSPPKIPGGATLVFHVELLNITS